MSRPLPSGVKRLESFAKRLLARIAVGLFWRPGRARRVAPALVAPRSVLLVRIDNRVGEALLTTPLFTALKSLHPAPRIHLVTHPKTRAVLEGHPDLDAVFTLGRRTAWLGPLSRVMRRLRAARYDLVVNCANWSTPAVTSALVARMASPHSALLGPDTPPVAALHDLSVAPREDTPSELHQRLHLLSPIRGLEPRPRLSFRQPKPLPVIAALLEQLQTTPYAVVNPGGRLGWRRIPPSTFAAAARALLSRGLLPLITWGPGEEPLAREVSSAVEGSQLAPPTTLDDLAALMRSARLTICNNTGPMHLSVAVSCPTLAFFLHMDLERWGHPYSPHRMIDLTPVRDHLPNFESRAESSVTAFISSQTPGTFL